MEQKYKKIRRLINLLHLVLIRNKSVKNKLLEINKNI